MADDKYEARACILILVFTIFNQFKHQVWQKQVFARRNPTLLLATFGLLGLFFFVIFGLFLGCFALFGLLGCLDYFVILGLCWGSGVILTTMAQHVSTVTTGHVVTATRGCWSAGSVGTPSLTCSDESFRRSLKTFLFAKY